MGRRSPLTALGGTPAYVSPEQAEALALAEPGTMRDAGTGLSLRLRCLELGSLHSRDADRTMLLDGGSRRRDHIREVSGWGNTRMQNTLDPEEMALVLRCALRSRPEGRFDKFIDAAEAACAIYESRKQFLRFNPKPQVEKIITDNEYERHSKVGGAWNDPRTRSPKCLTSTGQDPSEADGRVIRVSGSRRIRILADLYGYEEALNIYKDKQSDDAETAKRLAWLYRRKVFFHEISNDLRGAIACYDKACTLYESLIERRQRKRCLGGSCGLLLNKASLLGKATNDESALKVHGRAIAIYERLVVEESRHDLRRHLAVAYSNRAKEEFSIGGFDNHLAFAYSDKAIAIYHIS